MEILLVRPENNEQLKAVKAVLKVLNVDFVSKNEKKSQLSETFLPE